MKLVNIKILVATHKQYWMPEDSVYMPIHEDETVRLILVIQGIIQEIIYLQRMQITVN